MLNFIENITIKVFENITIKVFENILPYEKFRRSRKLSKICVSISISKYYGEIFRKFMTKIFVILQVVILRRSCKLTKYYGRKVTQYYARLNLLMFNKSLIIYLYFLLKLILYDT